MAVTEAHKRGNKKWDKENMTTIAARVKREKAERYKAHAAAKGKSLNTLIIELIEQDMKENAGE